MKTSLPDFSMAYEMCGQGTPLLFIHGYPLNRELWRPQLNALGSNALLIAPDLRGHGDSEPTEEVYTMDLLAQDCLLLLQAVQIDQPVVLCGLSMGGYVALAFYRLFPKKVAGLVLTATKPTADSPEIRHSRDQAIAEAASLGLRPIVEKMAPRLLSPQTKANHPELMNYVVEMMMHNSVQAIIGDLQGMKTRPDASPFLPEINVPVQIIHGLQDTIIPVTEVLEMQKQLPNAVMCILPGAGHLPNLEQPELFNQTLAAFLGRIKNE